MAARAAAPLHDPLAVACLLDPDVVRTVPARCTVETRDPTTYGATRFDLGRTGATLEVALDADHARYLAAARRHALRSLRRGARFPVRSAALVVFPGCPLWAATKH